MTRNYERALVILNPYSGRGHGEKARDELARLLRESSTRYDIVETEHPGHGIDLALAGRLAGYELVVAAGGDGTVSEVVNGLILANEILIERARVAAMAEAAAKAAAKAEAAEAKAAARAAAKAAKAAKVAEAAARAAAKVAEAAAKVAAKVAGDAADAIGGDAADDTADDAAPPVEPRAPEAAAEDAPPSGATPVAADASTACAEEDEPDDEQDDDADDEPAEAAEPEFDFEIPDDLIVAGTLGVVPVGSGNDFASMVGIPLDTAAAVKMLERRRLRMVDVGSADVVCPPGAGSEPRTVRRYFDNNLGVGLEASVTLESYKIRRLRGALLYATAAVRALLKHRSPRMHIMWRTQAGEEQSHDRPTLLVSVGNSRRTGGGFFLTPDAELDDKLLDVVIANDLPRPKVLTLLPRAMRGTHTNHPAVTMLRIDKMTILVPEGAPVQMDGEVVERHASEVHITVLPLKLELIA